MEPSRTAWGVDWSPLHIDSLLRAPLLHRLDLSTLGDRFVDLPVRWGQLTELTICPPSFSAFTAVDALTILSFTHRNIRRCSFFVDAPFTIDPPNYVQAFPFAHIHLLALESFALEFRNYAVGNGDDDHTCQDISAFMAVLSCPRLNHLVINAASQTSVMENSPLSQFLARSDCRLISLSTNLAMTTKAVEHTLQHIPSLNTLSAYTALYMIDGFVTWLEALTSMDPKNSELICPSLQHLRVCHVDSAHADSVLRVVRSRLDLPEAARLKSVHASFTRYTGESYRSEVEELRRLGLDIHWGFPRFDSGKVDDSPDDDHPNRSFHPFDWLLPDDRDSMETY
ncbi:hypothetical protein V5O48_010441 [Marasmius crinis-equi]|uniref:Uncharacterized protein n=1 Tax=Marasmius crinis-equi TaxID=585013 RepID=A0ABR3F8C9_9AGAR